MARLVIFTWIEYWYNPLHSHSELEIAHPMYKLATKSEYDIIQKDDVVQEA